MREKEERKKLAVFVLASNHFRKCFSVNAGVWLRMENKFSRNYFQLTVYFEGFDPKMVWSENFHFKPFPDSRAKKEREPSTSTLSIYEPTDLRTNHAFDFANFADHAFNFADLRTDLQPRAFDLPIYEPTNRSSTQSLRLRQRPRALAPRTHKLISLSLSVILIDPRTDLRFCVILIFYFLSLISGFFLLLLWWCGWWCFGGFPVVWWWVLCGWWWKIVFSECYQTHENIF